MLYLAGRIIQGAALFVILPLAVVGQALDRFNERDMLYLLVLGVVVFYIGWQMQERGRPPK